MTKKRAWIIGSACAVPILAGGAALLLWLMPFRESGGVRIEAEIDGGKTAVFDSRRPDDAKVSIDAGGAFRLTFVNGTEEAVAVELLLPDESVDLTLPADNVEKQDTGLRASLPAGGRCTVEGRAERDLFLPDGVLVEKEDGGEAYAGTAESLRLLAGKKDLLHTNVTLLRDIEIEGDLVFTGPGTLTLGEHDLTVSGDIRLQTDEPGEFRIANRKKGRLTSAAFYAEAPHCALVTERDCLDFNGRPGYYLRVASFNGEPIDGTRKTVRSAAELSRLTDMEQLPFLCAGDTVVLEQDMVLEEGLTLSLPVSLEILAKIEGPVAIHTRESGDVAIRVADGGFLDADNVVMEAPFCTLDWQGEGAPEVREVAERQNVRRYNGQDMTAYGLGGTGLGRVTGFSLQKADNPKAAEDLQWTIDGNRITVAVSYLIGEDVLTNAKLTVETEGGTAAFGEASDAGGGRINLLSDCRCTVTDENGDTRTYTVQTERLLYKLPVVNIHTDDGKAVTSQDIYKPGTVAIYCGEDVPYPTLDSTSAGIRGRGHSTWLWPKKPYKIKFDKKTSVLGMEKAKDWVLLANYSDKSLMRNGVAMEMGKALEHLAFTPSQIPVDVFFNGVYQGVYTMGEQVEVKNGRVEAQDAASEVDVTYLLEVGGSEDGDVLGKDFFHAGELRFVTVKHPDEEELTPAQFAYIQEYAQKANDAVVSLGNYEEYIDVDSLIDWLIIHEWSFNIDSCFRRSCFLTKQPGGKLTMGPIWDFDLAFGNFSRDEGNYKVWASVGTEEGYVKPNWMNHLMKDPRFMEKLKARWQEVKDLLLEKALAAIDDMAARIGPSQEMNFQVWKIWDIRAGYQSKEMVKLNTYDKQLTYLKTFLQTRYDWIDSQLT